MQAGQLGKTPAIKKPRSRRPSLAVIPVLDQGLRLYRRHFLTFLLTSLFWLVPMAALVWFAMPREELDPFLLIGSEPILFLLVMLYLPGLLLIAKPWAGLIIALLGLALMTALTQIIVDVEQGRAPSWRRAWHIRPGRIVGMVVLSIMYMVIALIALIATACIFGIIVQAFVALIEALPFSFGRGPGLLILTTLGMLFVATVMFTLLSAGGALLTGLCYVQQPLIQSQQAVGAAIGAGISALFGKLAQNLRLLISAGIVAASIWLAIWSWLVVLILVASSFVDLEESWAIVLVTGTLLSWIIAIPPLPIWAALAYRRQNTDVEQLTQLERRIQALTQPLAGLTLRARALAQPAIAEPGTEPEP